MMSDENVNWSVMEKWSYAYVDGKYAKIAVAADGDATMADPMTWAYAEAHSYVKVDPVSVGVSVPDDVKELYAKVIYMPGGGGGSGGGGGTYIEKDPVFKSVSATFAQKSYVDQKVAALSIPTKLSDLTNDKDFIASSMIGEGDSQIALNSNVHSYVDQAIAAIDVPVKMSDLENDRGFITSSLIGEGDGQISVNSAVFAYIDEAVDGISVPVNFSDLNDDIGVVTIQYVDDTFATKASQTELHENLLNYIDERISAVSSEMMTKINLQNAKIVSLQAELGQDVEMNKRLDGGDDLNLNDRTDESLIIDFN